MSRLVSVELDEYVISALEKEYTKRGLGITLPGSLPSPMDVAIKRIVDAARLVPGEAKAVHRYALRPQPVFDKALAASEELRAEKKGT